MADETPVKQKQREPITMFFGIILLAACLLAIGIFISDHVLGDDEDKVTNTSKVTVDYPGAIYGYYDEGGAIFQTTIDSIDDNEKYRHTPTYTFNNSTITVDMANPTVLSMFASALEGHSVGDTIRVAIPASEAYDKPVVYAPSRPDRSHNGSRCWRSRVCGAIAQCRQWSPWCPVAWRCSG